MKFRVNYYSGGKLRTWYTEELPSWVHLQNSMHAESIYFDNVISIQTLPEEDNAP